ncbi:MAG TPA: type IX secretion system membrane protein PorP/SprF [Pedobacter sp.]|jgi:type IX secretion system PorP/SprF family membrane protein
MKRIIIVVIILIFALVGYGQQKAMYTQYMFNTLAINPAYASVDESLTVTALTRHQWIGYDGAPSTQTLSIHSPLGISNTFIGGILINDRIGQVLKETGGTFSLSQRVEVGSEEYLAVGANAGVSSFRAGYSELYDQSPESINDPVFHNSNNIRGNFGIGVMYFSQKFYLGLSSPHFYQKDFSSYSKETASRTVKPYYLFQAGSIIEFNYDLKFKPNLLIKYVNGSPAQFDINANFLIKETLWLGASYRSYDSFDALASVFITPDIQLGYSYDFAHTELAKVQKGSHEVMLKFRFAVKGRDHKACYW